MAVIDQSRRIKCPACGYERTITVSVREEVDLTIAVKGMGDVVEAVKSIRRDSELDRANAFFQVTCPNPTCPIKKYEYNALTGETRQ